MGSLNEFKDLKIDEISLGKILARDKMNFYRVLTVLESWLAEIKRDLKEYSLNDKSNLPSHPSPALPPEIPQKPKELNAKERQKELDRILRQHGIEEKNATADQRAFYERYIGKSQEEIASMIMDEIKNDKSSKVNKNVVKGMKALESMYTPAPGNEMTTLESIYNTIADKDGAKVPYDMVPSEHLALLLDAMKAEGVNPLGKADLPPKQDLSQFGLAGVLAFAVEQLYAKEDIRNLIETVESGKKTLKANELIGDITKAYEEKVVDKTKAKTNDMSMTEALRRTRQAKTADNVARREERDRVRAERQARQDALDAMTPDERTAFEAEERLAEESKANNKTERDALKASIIAKRANPDAEMRDTIKAGMAKLKEAEEATKPKNPEAEAEM